MDGLISRAAAIADVEQWAEHGYDVIHWTGIKAMLEAQPTVAAVPVVHCRDCKHGEPTHNARGEAVIKCEEICWLCRLPRLMEPDWFCADGERRDEDGQIN